MARMRDDVTTDDYRKALSGEGDMWSLGYEWSDKPHRLVYDLCGEVDYLRAAVAAEREACASKAREFAGHYPEGSDGRNTFILLAEWIERRAALTI